MAQRELDCIVWCATCKVEKYRVYRVPTGSEGVYRNETDPAGAVGKVCEVCDGLLTRKP